MYHGRYFIITEGFVQNTSLPLPSNAGIRWRDPHYASPRNTHARAKNSARYRMFDICRDEYRNKRQGVAQNKRAPHTVNGAGMKQQLNVQQAFQPAALQLGQGDTKTHRVCSNQQRDKRGRPAYHRPPRHKISFGATRFVRSGKRTNF